ncbi:hypothetical protein RD792_006285 [Penstemon davidsonii]|uniref:O-methyltransferase n=1 Tax=Penstemon davidsonii TaxID=160366 RepID=A0ABR0DDC7_9LAMI|nr:hypothetical protein RD792_006285 [Penstemon davidsonii]
MTLLNGLQSSDELLEAQAHVWNHIFNFVNSMSLKCALQLNIPDIIHKHNKPITLSELINALPINKAKSHHIYRLMRILIHSKFFVKVNISEKDEEGYWLTPSSRLLLKNGPSSMAPFALAMLDPVLVDPWHHLGEWFQDDSPMAFVTAHGRTFWDKAIKEPRVNQFFNEAMTSDAQFVANLLIKDCKHVFDGLKSMVDVGGGTGGMAKVMVEACPGLNCVVLELEHVIDGLKGDEKLSFVVGDMFVSIPRADAVFLKWILHDWSDEDCVKILKKCKEAIPSKDNGGKVIIVEIIVDDQKKLDHEKVETQLFFDMEMMTIIAGKERTEKEWAKLFFDAGFTSYKITLLGLRALIEVFP